MTLVAVPNVSEGRDPEAIEAIGKAFASQGARLLDTHSDADHNRSVFTLAAEELDGLVASLAAGARECIARVDMRVHEGVHPCVGALDVCPLVHLDASHRGSACVAALVTGDQLGRELELPIVLYGALGRGRTRAELRRGGLAELSRRLGRGELAPDFGPSQVHPSAGATLVTARPPLVAFNLELAAPARVGEARAIAAKLREGGPEGLPGVRAIGLWLARREIAQVSFNVEAPARAALAALVEAAGRHAGVASAEVVGMAPRAALEQFPSDVPIHGFEPSRQLLENALGL